MCNIDVQYLHENNKRTFEQFSTENQQVIKHKHSQIDVMPSDIQPIFFIAWLTGLTAKLI